MNDVLPNDKSPAAQPSEPEAKENKPKAQLSVVSNNDKPNDWMKHLLRTGPKATAPIAKAMLNAERAFKHCPDLQGALSYNASALTVNIERPLPWDHPSNEAPWIAREWTDNDDRMFLMWLEERKIMLNLRVVSEAVQAVANKRTFHPVREYLRALKWDGVKRVEDWLSKYLSAEDTVFNRAAGLRWLVSGIARIEKPGCQADCMLILCGAQGTRKSTALRILGGDWFTDEIRALGTKDTSLGLAGTWVVEFAELEAFKDESLEKLKAFLSRRIDRFRPPYGRSVIDVKRQCIFAGTTNHKESLKDETGNRRFWPAACGSVDIDALTRDRDQLWAEAYVLFGEGQPWWMETEELQRVVALTTAEYECVELDPWEEVVQDHFAKALDVSAKEAFCVITGKDEEEATPSDFRRIAKILRRLGFERRKIRDSKGIMKWRFTRTSV